MNDIKCPCEECICVPICRHKHYSQMVRDCIIIGYHLYEEGDFSSKNRVRRFYSYLDIVRYTLNPTKWSVVVGTDKNLLHIRIGE